MLAANCGIACQAGICWQQDGVWGKLEGRCLYPETLCASWQWWNLLWWEAWPACRHAGFFATRGGIVSHLIILISVSDRLPKQTLKNKCTCYAVLHEFLRHAKKSATINSRPYLRTELPVLPIASDHHEVSLSKLQSRISTLGDSPVFVDL
ncbi:hypothetical protein CC86DRAFT_39121 [Ophiobolus disseminans]|uniref:Uncharacterized protein n=1 Tax=Ophiobolus disseminans TaxID=1469910 RepID=A0A6A6ZW66_9PLEO|nr:hypothetical protein CC86DRAFT_39121 [Ophiobolus disseminans]